MLNLTVEQREQIRNLLRQAAYHRAEMWDSLGGIEKILDLEVDSNNIIFDSIAADIGVPASYPEIDNERLDDFLEEVEINAE